MEEQKDLGSYSEGGPVSAALVPSANGGVDQLWPEKSGDGKFSVLDPDPADDHSAIYLVCPNGLMVNTSCDPTPGLDAARTQWMADTLNAAETSSNARSLLAFVQNIARLPNERMSMMEAKRLRERAAELTQVPKPIWPAGCDHPNSCSRHGWCMYVHCVHEGDKVESPARKTEQ